ncbi:MAG: ComEC/Rec2 family competence protein [Thermacetogeniaceae bacterium]
MSSKNKWRSLLFLILVFLLILVLVGCGSHAATKEHSVAQPKAVETAPNSQAADQEKQPAAAPARLVVHFIDVGQGDSILLQLPDGRTMLVDAGPDEAGSEVVSYLQREGVKRIDYLVATHPHADHIGGMDEVVRAFEIGKVYMPRVTANTESFENLLRSLRAKGLKITPARAGLAVLDEDGLKASFLAPCRLRYEELNDWSAVLKVSYGNTSFLLTGDAQAESELEMLASGADLKADVLKVGHHGSSSSTSWAFLEAVSPKYAVICVGAGNDYGHPHRETLAKLAAAGVKVYRTDRDGTVVFVSDGESLSVKRLRR